MGKLGKLVNVMVWILAVMVALSERNATQAESQGEGEGTGIAQGGLTGRRAHEAGGEGTAASGSSQAATATLTGAAPPASAGATSDAGAAGTAQAERETSAGAGQAAAGQGTDWVEGNGSHDCPAGFPIKGNASSMIYHVPGESSYESTIPEICFASDDAAAAQGYRARKH